MVHVDEPYDLELSKAIAKQHHRINFFSQCLFIEEELMLLVNGKTLYIRDEKIKSNWRSHFDFDSIIIAIFYIGENLVQCLTQNSINLLKLDPKTKEFSLKLTKATPGPV